MSYIEEDYCGIVEKMVIFHTERRIVIGGIVEKKVLYHTERGIVMVYLKRSLSIIQSG